MAASDTFADFCQAWTARFPNSELPEAWEEDVRANLSKHRNKVASLREELEKEEMYVKYLEKLLADIEYHRQKSTNSQSSATDSLSAVDNEGDQGDRLESLASLTESETDKDMESTDNNTDNGVSTEDSSVHHPQQRSSLHFEPHQALQDDLAPTNANSVSKDQASSPVAGVANGFAAKMTPSQFVTVINVTSPKDKKGVEGTSAPRSLSSFDPGDLKNSSGKNSLNGIDGQLTFTKTGKQMFEADPGQPEAGLKKVGLPRLPLETAFTSADSQESLNSISSPLSPSSPNYDGGHPLASPRGAPASPRESSLLGMENSSSEGSPISSAASSRKPSANSRMFTKQTSSSGKVAPEPPERSVSVKSSASSTLDRKYSSDQSCASSELHASVHSRGRPDGGEMDDLVSSSTSNSNNSTAAGRGSAAKSSPSHPQINVKDLRAGWEKKGAVQPPQLPRDRMDSLDSNLTASLGRRSMAAGVGQPPLPVPRPRTLSNAAARRTSGGLSGRSEDAGEDGGHQSPDQDEGELGCGQEDTQNLKGSSLESEVRTSKDSLLEDEDEEELEPSVDLPSSRRKDSDTSSRGRMGSPSGKSHDSSDSEHSWGQPSLAAKQAGSASKQQLAWTQQQHLRSNNNGARVSGEVRLDRLVRKPSSGSVGASAAGSRGPPPALPKPRKSANGKGISAAHVGSGLLRRSSSGSKKSSSNNGHEEDLDGDKADSLANSEPLYDQVANEEPEDEYDNHLLYGTGGRAAAGQMSSKNKNIGRKLPTPGNSGAPGRPNGRKSSSSSSKREDDDIDASPSLARKVVEMDEEETNYVNIQYFLSQTRARDQGHHKQASKRQTKVNQKHRIEGDEDEEEDGSDDNLERSRGLEDDADDSLLAIRDTSIANSSSGNTSRTDSLESSLRMSSHPNGGRRSLSNLGEDEAGETSLGNGKRIVMWRHILNSILESESIYIECLSVCLQYMKAMKVTLSTNAPVIPKEEFEVIFFKIPELYEYHHHFYENLKKQVDRWTGEERLGHHFKMLAQQTRIYALYFNNYPKAIEALHRCSQQYSKFADLTYSIKLRTLKGQQQSQSVTLEDLLYKPIARVQKNAQSLQDLLKHTPEKHADHANLSESLSLIQNFLNQNNLGNRGLDQLPHQERVQRHLVKNSFIVELADGVRKLRHLLLFNDVMVCAKYKAANRGEKFNFQLKWYIPLSEALIVQEPSSEPRELKPANLVALKTNIMSLRDYMYQSDGGRPRGSDKQRKQLAELEAQLVLASPHLLFQVSSKSGRTFSFYLSSEYERSQWVETLRNLQANLPPNTSEAHSLSMAELQTWIHSCRKLLKTNMGSFLMRSVRDEPLLVGDLHFMVNNLGSLTRTADLFIVAEVDSYGHYFRKVRTRTVSNTLEPTWNEEFLVELEGSENLRLLVYQETPNEGPVLRGKASLELSRSWLTTEYLQQRISLGDLILTCEMKFVPFEETLRRVPQSKSTGLFKSPIQQTTKREKRAVPFIITSCVREVERRGISEVGIYRVSGSSADMSRVKKAFESNPYEAEQLLKECDIHAVAGVLKQFLREIPECIFTTETYMKLFDAYSIPDQDIRSRTYLQLFSQVPQNPNQACIVFLIEHLVRVAKLEAQNKMSLHNLATVFGPTMLHAGQERDKKGGDLLAASTVDVMAQSGILHFFISRRARGEPIQVLQ